ncbi:MAG: hypothetical protein E6051_21735 [Citrobacter freundii]|nr:hypothetical protein [Citrobacter freundii]
MKPIAQENIIELAKLGHERAAELKASCGAVDVRSLAQLISDLATQLEVQLVRGNALAAENARLKAAAEFATAEDMWIEQADGMLDYRYVDWYVDVLKAAMETPSTDAFLAEVRAQARNELIDELESRFNEMTETLPPELRSGAAGAAAFVSTLRKGAAL